MRAVAVLVLVAASAACGGSTPPPATPSSDTSSDTSSLEASGSKGSKDTSDDSTSPASSASAAAPPAASAAPASSAADDSSAPPAAAFHPAPAATGTIDGKPFSPKVAQVIGPMKKDGRIPLAITEATDCPAAGEKIAYPAITMLIPWDKGYKVDLSALKLGGKKGPGEIAFSRGKKDMSTTFKPSGKATVVAAPMDKGATGKLNVDLQSGDYMLAGTLDVEVCVAPK